MAYATVEQVSNVLNLTPRRINQLVKDEGMPRVSRGEYEMVKCVQWYIRFLRDQLEVARHGTETEAQARLRLIQYTADLRRLDLAERTCEVIRIDDVMSEIDPVLIAIKSKLLAVPRRAAPLVIGVTTHHEVVTLLDDFIRELLLELSRLPVQLRSIGKKKKRRQAEEDEDTDETVDEVTGMDMNFEKKRKMRIQKKRKSILKKRSDLKKEMAAVPPPGGKTSDPGAI